MSLMGDAVDNIPGVKGIGEKTAVELIAEFGSLDELYKNIDKVKSDARKRLLSENKEMAYLSRELASLDENVPLKIDFVRVSVGTEHIDDIIADFDQALKKAQG